MKASELMKKSETELHKHLADWRAQLAELHRDRFVVETKNVRQARAVRKDIARSLTVLRDLQDKSDTAAAESKPKKVKEN